MQDEEVSLDESFEMYKKGIEIVKDSNEQIEKIEKQIEEYNHKNNVNFVLYLFGSTKIGISEYLIRLSEEQVYK